MVVVSTHGKAVVAGLALAAIAGCLGGCPGAEEFLNPSVFQSLGIGKVAANVPGEAPAIVIEVENGTERVIEFRVTWRDGDGQIQQRTEVLGVGDKFSEALICPIEEMTLGDVSNLDAVGAIVRLGDGTANDPYVEVEAFGVLLQEGINYDCGDAVTFTVLPSSLTLSGYQSFAFIQRTGAQTETDTAAENP
jgi:hypothetical protein